MTLEELWQAVLAQIQLNTSPANFATWFAGTKIISKENGAVIVSVLNSFSKEWLEQKYHKEILKILWALDKSVKEVTYKVDSVKIKVKSIPKTEPPDVSVGQLGFLELEIDKETNLNPRYNFENFVVGPFNELATAAATAAIKDPGRIYNPLFIYGRVGLGKTHLLQAMGNEASKIKPQKKIRYIPSEKLISMVVNSIRNHNIEELKSDLRKIDILIVDDVQFFAGKDKTQEEFFHIFNTLYQENKQIVLSSDRSPKAIPAITERLKSRFEGGMVADIGFPDYETRLAILKQKSQEKNADFPVKILEYAATNIQKNIRELESALNRLIVFKKINGKIPTLEETKKLLRNIIVSPSRFTNPSKIIQVINEFYDLDNKNFFYSSRKKEFARPRQLAMYLLRKELNLSFPAIGRKFGGKDHTTVIHACHLIEKEFQENEKFNQEVELILQRVYSA
ncbi:MAG: chromosomal replication initiator protein DnaA [Candidatus Nealsonbacteria bacterium CG_4_8_14_3_um_filter_34_13]|nr:MAG: chromosomal replication initiator protein DnaA [Candidatus Nealsonbacteria bacterium CG11_big_fil_rev_8_21_14_0_20_35_11]PIW92421.1 MAG: chromosomal replication initiator protein DnaA [Candidatus Nealsonbacteria bacterium CG_4_8_14_3_um_filter_34_13]